MKRYWFFLPIMLAAGFLLYLLLPKGERQRVDAWRGWEGKTYLQPYYLAEKLLAHHGASVSVRKVPDGRWPLQDIDMLVLDSRQILTFENIMDWRHSLEEKAAVSKSQRRSLKNWVWRGGVLMLDAGLDEAEGFASYSTAPLPEASSKAQYQQITWRGRHGRIAGLDTACPTVAAPTWADSVTPMIDGRGCVVAVEYRYGKGRVFAYSPDAAFWSASPQWVKDVQWFGVEKNVPLEEGQGMQDVPILQDDNADIWADVTRGVRHYRRYILSGERNPEVPLEFAWQSWLPLILAVLIGAVFAAWRGGVRFGSLLPTEAVLDGRDWQAHFRAAGRYLLTQRQQQALAAESRARLLRETAGAPEAVRAAAAAAAAMPVRTSAEFLHFMAAVDALRSNMRGQV